MSLHENTIRTINDGCLSQGPAPLPVMPSTVGSSPRTPGTPASRTHGLGRSFTSLSCITWLPNNPLAHVPGAAQQWAVFFPWILSA